MIPFPTSLISYSQYYILYYIVIYSLEQYNKAYNRIYRLVKLTYFELLIPLYMLPFPPSLLFPLLYALFYSSLHEQTSTQSFELFDSYTLCEHVILINYAIACFIKVTLTQEKKTNIQKILVPSLKKPTAPCTVVLNRRTFIYSFQSLIIN